MDKHIPDGIEDAEPVPYNAQVKKTHLRWRVPVQQTFYPKTGDIKEAFSSLGWSFVHNHYRIDKHDPTRAMKQYLVFERLREGDEILGNK